MNLKMHSKNFLNFQKTLKNIQQNLGIISNICQDLKWNTCYVNWNISRNVAKCLVFVGYCKKKRNVKIVSPITSLEILNSYHFMWVVLHYAAFM